MKRTPSTIRRHGPKLPAPAGSVPGPLGALSFTPTLSGLHSANWIVVPLLLLAAFFLLRVYRVDGRHLTPSRRRLLWILRSATMLLVLLLILKPSVRLVRHEERLPVAAVLLDESTSMNFPAAHTDPLVAANPRNERTRFHGTLEALDILQQELSLQHRVEVFTFSDTIQPALDVPLRGDRRQPPLPRQKLDEALKRPDGEYTDAGDAVISVLERLAGEKISGLFLLSDGRVTGGESLDAAASRAAQAGVRTHTLAFGSEDPLRDLRIDRIVAPTEASLGDILELQVEVANYIEPGLKVDLKLFEEGELSQTKSVVLPIDVSRVGLTTVPRTEGLREYRVELPVMADEVDPANNAAAVHVRVVRKTLSVLLVAGKPTREYQHLVLCLLRDPILRVSCFLQSANVDYVQQGNVVINRLPRTTEEWRDYDVILLYDVDPKPLTSQQVSGLEQTVTKGAGFILVAGRNYGVGQMLQIHAAKMRELLPVDIDKNLSPDYERFFLKPWRVERTPEAHDHPVCRLAADDTLNEEMWTAFPPLYWRQPVLRVKSQAVPVLRAVDDPDTADRGDCVMAIQRFGEGVSIYLGTDEIWRWRNPYGPYDYDLFWGHMIRYLGETRLHGAQKQAALATDKLVYAPGEKARLRLQILDPALLQQLRGEALSVTVVDGAKVRTVLPLEQDRAGRPVYEGVFPARTVGAYVAEARHHLTTADSEAKDLFDVNAAFAVELRPLETIDTRADLDGMQRLAEKTGGTSLNYHTMTRDRVLELAQSIPADKLSIPRETVHELWDTWTVLLLVFGLLSVEWALRKYWGLL